MGYLLEVQQTILSQRKIHLTMRHRSSMALRPIHRIKHVVDSNFSLTAGTPVTQNIALAKDAPVLAGTTEVETGSKINGIYLRVEVASNETDAGAIPNAYLMISKNPGGNITLPVPNAVGASDNKRFIIHQEMVMVNNLAGGTPRTLFNGVIAIPKGYRRFGPNDSLQITVHSLAVNLVVCYQVHYKEFR